MNAHEHEMLRTDLGAYLLGGLDAGRTAALEIHLAGCDTCTAELEGLRPTAASLAGLRAITDLGEAGSPPADLGSRVYDAVVADRREDRRRSWRGRAVVAAVAGAAAAAVLVVGFAVVGPTEDAPVAAVPTEDVPVTVERPGQRTGVVADADLVNHTWGVEVKLSGSGFTAGERYRVSVLDTRGRRFPAGEFVGVGTADMVCNLNSSLMRDRAAGFEVRDRDGDVVVTSVFA